MSKMKAMSFCHKLYSLSLSEVSIMYSVAQGRILGMILHTSVSPIFLIQLLRPDLFYMLALPEPLLFSPFYCHYPTLKCFYLLPVLPQQSPKWFFPSFCCPSCNPVCTQLASVVFRNHKYDYVAPVQSPEVIFSLLTWSILTVLICPKWSARFFPS